MWMLVLGLQRITGNIVKVDSGEVEIRGSKRAALLHKGDKGHGGIMLTKGTSDKPPKLHMAIVEPDAGATLPDTFELFPAASEDPADLTGKIHYRMEFQKDGSSHIASKQELDTATSAKKTKLTTKKHDGGNDQGTKMKKQAKQKKKPLGTGNHRLLLQTDDDTGYGDEETLNDSQVGVDDNGVSVPASNNINLAAGTNTNIVTGGAVANNTAIQQTANTFEVAVLGPAEVGGRRLLAAERKQSLFRLDAEGGIHMASKMGMTVQADTLQVTGSLAASDGLQVTGPLVANTGIEVKGDVALAGNLVIPSGATELSFKMGSWTLSEDLKTGDLVFKYKGSSKQAVLRNPLKSSACPGSKLAKWCVE
ncbi:hypothetical protein OEZ86_011131 [Tetradesmus obliquus]|nr:hypothetical protein OEZ86_011131 [Tetradesmus obliquus]